MKEMTPRERVLATIDHQAFDCMPLTLDVGASAGIDRSYIDIFKKNTGADDPAEYFDYDIRFIKAPLTPTADNFDQYYGSLEQGTTFDEFGVAHVPVKDFPLGMDLHPWKDFTTVDQIHSYPFPTFDLSRPYRERISEFHKRNYAVSASSGSINEWCYQLRGMDNFMMDLVLNPEIAEETLNLVTNLCITMGRLYTEAGVDIVCFYGDMGSQNSLLMSPSMWNEWIKPRWKYIIDSVREVNKNIKVFYHSCGYIEPIIPGLIEVGFDILNPIQPESMDPIKIKKEFGHDICLWGGIGMQSTMLTGSPDDVRMAVKDLIEAWSPGSGAIVTAAQTMLTDVPWANVEMLVNTIRDQGS